MGTLRAQGESAGDGDQPQCTRGIELARQWNGRALEWDHLLEAIAAADLVVSTTGAAQPIVTCQQFAQIQRSRYGRPLFILDLCGFRDSSSAIGSRPGVYLYAIDDSREVCDRNRAERDKELPLAMRIIDEETSRFMAECTPPRGGPHPPTAQSGVAETQGLEIGAPFDACRSSTRRPAIRFRAAG